MSFTLRSCYASGMLFQQGKPIVLAGSGRAGQSVSALLSQEGNKMESADTVIAPDGKWTLSFSAQPGGYMPYSIELMENGVHICTLTDILVGELWLASGQSNMEYKLMLDPVGHEVLQHPDDRFLRMFLMPDLPSGDWAGDMPYEPQADIPHAYWTDGTDAAGLGLLSAVAYHFAAKLRRELDCPVGILNTAIGSARIYTFLSREAIDGDARVQGYLQSTGQYLTRTEWNQQGAENFNQMTNIYNQKIHPLTTLSIRGMIWYQGESNLKDPIGSYGDALELLLQDYSARFGFPADRMPMIYSHIAPETYAHEGLSMDRHGFFAEDLACVCAKHPANVAQITVYDLPAEYDYTSFCPDYGVIAACHPMHKQGVGERMARAALGISYGKKGEYTSPVFERVRTEGNRLYLTFAHVGDGLAVQPPPYATVRENAYTLNGFTIAGADGVYVPARAEIVSPNTVCVWNDTIAHPRAAAYAFTQIANRANLVSRVDGINAFAAVPFRTEVIEGAQYCQPHDWTSCELEKLWHYTDWMTGGAFDCWSTGYGDVDGSKVTLSCDPAVRQTGAASLKAAYTLGTDRAVQLTPVLADPGRTTALHPRDGFVGFQDTDSDYSRFGSLSVAVYHPSAQPMRLEMALYTANGVRYRPFVSGLEETSTLLSAEDGWQEVTFDLTRLCQDTAAELASNEMLGNITAIQFILTAPGAQVGTNGCVYFDRISFGL